MFYVTFSPLSRTLNNLKCYACRFLCKIFFWLRITARRIFLRQVFFAGILLLGTVTLSPVISNGPSLKGARKNGAREGETRVSLARHVLSYAHYFLSACYAGKPDRFWLLIAHKIILCAQSQKSIRMSRGTCSLRVTSQELSCPFSVKTFAAVFPDPTDRPWLSEDVIK